MWNDARRAGLKTIWSGLGIVALAVGALVAMVYLEFESVIGMGFALIGWGISGYGVGEVLCGDKLKPVKIALAILIALAGFTTTWLTVELVFGVTFEP